MDANNFYNATNTFYKLTTLLPVSVYYKVDSMKEKYIAEHIDKVSEYNTRVFRKNYILCYTKLKNF